MQQDPTGATNESPPAEAQDVPSDASAEDSPSAALHPKDRAKALQQLNERHAVVNDHGKIVIAERLPTGAIRESTPTDFRQQYANNYYRRGKDSPSVPIGRTWLASPSRRECMGGYVYLPGDEPIIPVGEGLTAMNRWSGWGCKPRPYSDGMCDTFIEHLRENVCGGVEAHYEWLLDWLANAVQQPDRKSGHAVILRGRQGSGKSILADRLNALVGPQNCVTVASETLITGTFNAHLSNKLFLFSEEAVWAGSKTARGTLKNLVTSHQWTIHPKGRTPRTEPNLIRLLMTSNESFVWPAEIDDRRAVIFDVSSDRIGDSDFFNKIGEEMGYEGARPADGAAVFLHMLLTRKINEQRLRNEAPVTQGLRDQFEQNMTDAERLALHILENGTIPGAGQLTDDGTAQKLIMDDFVAEAYDAIGPRAMQNLDRRQLGKDLKGLLGLTDDGWSRRSRASQMPTLAEARAHFSQNHRAAPAEWPDPDAKWSTRSIEQVQTSLSRVPAKQKGTA